MSKEIEEIELELAESMRNGDVATLDRLISDELQFVTLGGVVLTKEDDIAGHRSGIFKIQKLELRDQLIKQFENVATVTVLADMAATYDNQPITGTFRFGRTWYKSGGSWKIITGTLVKV